MSLMSGAPDAYWASILGRTGKALCGLTGHSTVAKREPERLALVCINCGHESPGWVLERALTRGEVSAVENEQVPGPTPDAPAEPTPATEPAAEDQPTQQADGASER